MMVWVLLLEPDGAARPLARCFYTATDGTPAPGRKVHVAANASLTAAYAEAACGDTLLLDPLGEWDGFDFFSKNCTDAAWIWVASAALDELPPEGERITPCYAGFANMPARPAYDCPSPRRLMPKIVFTAPNEMTVSGNHIRFIGINFGAKEGAPPVHDYVSVWGSHHVFHGGTQGSSRDGVQTQYADNVHKIPAYDVEVRRNHFYKPWTWNPWHPSWTGKSELSEGMQCSPEM
eukprot:gene19598-63034_t